MREFNVREKNIIKMFCLIDLQNIHLLSYHLKNEYFLKENNQALIVHKGEEIASLFLKKEVFDNINLRKKEYFLFMELLALIDYLKKHRYITIFPMSDENDKNLIVIKQSFDYQGVDKNITYLNKDGTYIHNSSGKIHNKDGNVIYEGFTLTKEMYSLVLQYIEGVVVVSEELIDLYNNNYKTKDDRKFNDSQKVAWFGIIVALFISVFNLCLSFRKIENNVILDKDQFQIFRKKYDKIIKTNEEIKYYIQNLKNDSINKDISKK